MKKLVVALVVMLPCAACPHQESSGEGEGEGEGEGDFSCHPACTAAGTACAQDNCGHPICETLVTNAGDSCSATSPFCPDGGSHPCAPGLECTGIGGAALTCSEVGQDGAGCDPSVGYPSRDGCADGFTCLPEEKLCGRSCAAGGACAGTDECVADVCFAVSPEGGTCPIEATIDIDNRHDGCEAGVRCGFDQQGAGPLCIRDECQTDADCPGGTCHLPGCVLSARRCAALVPEGGACFAGCTGGGCDNFTEACAAGLECEHFVDTCANGGSLGTCVVPGGQGASCSVTGNQATDGCQAGLGCDQTAHACL